MRGRLQNNTDNTSYKIILIKYVRNVTGCGLREAKEFVEGTGVLHNLTPEHNRQLGYIFGWNYQFQSDDWQTYS